MSEVTYSGSWPTVDITHRSKRSQAGNLALARKNKSESVDPAPSGIEVPKTITIERAIEYYESHADGEFSTLYTATAKWLRDYMTKKNTPAPSSSGSVDLNDSEVEKAMEFLGKVKEGNP